VRRNIRSRRVHFTREGNFIIPSHLCGVPVFFVESAGKGHGAAIVMTFDAAKPSGDGS
jgi:hypothetical protein